MATRSQRARTIASCVALALLPAGPIAADEAGEERDPPPGALRRIEELRPQVSDLVYKTLALEGTAADLGGKTGGVAGKPAGLVAKVEDLAIHETQTEIKIQIAGDILFDFDKATLRPEATPILERVAALIRKHGKPMVRIDGYTDSKGNDEYNMKLSIRRADTVKTWLASKGAVGGVLFSKGFGEANPVAPNEKSDGSDDPEGRQKNRRVEITVKKM